jgi:hypothetical protein
LQRVRKNVRFHYNSFDCSVVDILLFFSKLNDARKYLFKKYVYTINHKRIAINYFFFSM